MKNFKFLGAMLVFLVSLESCKGCAVGAGAGADAGCPAGQVKVNGACVAKCPSGEVDIDGVKTCIVVVADEPELAAEIQKATAGGNWTANLNYIDTSKVTDMQVLFANKAIAGGGYDLEKFNGRIDKWNTSNVTSMRSMFWGAVAFDQPIGNWKTDNVANMSYMFYDASKFNQPIGNWNVSKVTDMGIMFKGAAKFKQDLSKWTPAITSDFFLSNVFDGSAMFTANMLPTFAPWYCTISGAGTGAGGGCP